MTTIKDIQNQFQSSDIVDGTKMEYQQGGNALSGLLIVSDNLNSSILTRSPPTVSDVITLPTVTYAPSPSPFQNNDAVSQLKLL